MKQVHVIGGGTVFHVRPHFALAAPAYGKAAHDIVEACRYAQDFDGEVHLYTTKMAGDVHMAWRIEPGREDKQIIPKPIEEDEEKHEGLHLETNEDIADLLNKLMIDPAPKVIFLPAALCDFEVAHILEPIDRIGETNEGGKPNCGVGRDLPRLRSSDAPFVMRLTAAEKVIQRIRKFRKDIFLVGFKTTTDASPQDQFNAGLALLKTASCNLVLANDIVTRTNMIITPEQSAPYVTTARIDAIYYLVKMALARSSGTFTRSTIVPGDPIRWDSSMVPETLRSVVNHCIQRGAYKPFLGATVGHFAFKLNDRKFVTSRRKVNFNELDKIGMVLVEADGDDKVIAHGFKPSVGGQSQRIVFAQHPDVDCIVHFHCPLRPQFVDEFNTRPQWAHECGSHGCGKNTSDGLKSFQLRSMESDTVKAVMLDNHGPNIVFNRMVDPKYVIEFIERYWDLERSTSEVVL